jgi:hypothetical protein
VELIMIGEVTNDWIFDWKNGRKKRNKHGTEDK